MSNQDKASLLGDAKDQVRNVLKAIEDRISQVTLINPESHEQIFDEIVDLQEELDNKIERIAALVEEEDEEG